MLRAHAADAFGSALSSQVTSWRGWWDGPTPPAALIALIAPLAPAAACSRLPGPDPPWEERLLGATIRRQGTDRFGDVSERRPSMRKDCERRLSRSRIQ